MEQTYLAPKPPEHAILDLPVRERVQRELVASIPTDAAGRWSRHCCDGKMSEGLTNATSSPSPSWTPWMGDGGREERSEQRKSARRRAAAAEGPGSHARSYLRLAPPASDSHFAPSCSGEQRPSCLPLLRRAEAFLLPTCFVAPATASVRRPRRSSRRATTTTPFLGRGTRRARAQLR